MSNSPGRLGSIVGMAVSVSLVIVLGHPSAVATPQSPTNTDEAAVLTLSSQYYAAYAKKDLAAITALWSSKSPNLATQQKANEQFFTGNDQIEVANLSVRQLKVEGSERYLRASFEMSAVSAKTHDPTVGMGDKVRNIECMKEDGGWKIWRESDAFDDLASLLLAAKSEQERTSILQQEPDLAKRELSTALIRQGLSLRAQGNLAQAEAAFRVAHEVAASMGNEAGIAEALLQIGFVNQIQGDHRHALEQYEQSLKLAEKLNDKALVGRSLLNLGSAHYSLNDYVQALDEFTKSLDIAESLRDRSQIAKACLNIGQVYRSQANFDKALSYYQRSLDSSDPEGDNQADAARALIGMANIYRLRGNNALAMQYFQESLKKLGPNGEAYVLGTALNGIGHLYRFQGDYDQALEYYQRGKELGEKMGSKLYVAGFLENIGLVEEQRGNLANAEADLQKSLAFFQENGDQDSAVDVLGCIADVQEAEGRTAEAIDTYKKALAQSESIGDQESIGPDAVSIAQLYNKQGRFEEALKFSQKSSEAATKIGARYTIWEALESAGRAYRGLGQPEKARRSFEDAIADIELLRNQIAGGEEEQESFFSERVTPYFDMVDLLQAQERPAEAIVYAERAKGRALLDVLRSGKVRITKAMTPSEAEQEQQLQAKLVALNKQAQEASAAEKPDASAIAKLNEQLESERRQYSDFLVGLYTAHQDLKAQRGEMRPLTIDEASQLLPDANTALLEFATGEEKTFLFVLTKAGSADHSTAKLNVYSIAVPQKELGKKAEALREQLARRDLSFRPQARELFNLLLLPAQKQLAGRNSWLIVPDGPLWNLPFQALVSEQNRYLIEDHTIAYAPSLTVLQEMMRLRQKRSAEPNSAAATTLLAMGNPTVGQQVTRRVQTAYRDETLEPLPEAEAEVKTLGELYGSKETEIYVGAEAREDRFKADAGNARLLHLATHGFLNDSSPMYSHLVLTAAEGNTQEDGLLEAWEIMQLDLKADLAVLSACETARGRISSGEGIIGLAWAFFVAGTPTTVVSQWKVESSSTTQLMTAFHRARKANLGQPGSSFATARALREAELQLLHSKPYAHPFYWAAFVEVGNPN